MERDYELWAREEYRFCDIPYPETLEELKFFEERFQKDYGNHPDVIAEAAGTKPPSSAEIQAFEESAEMDGKDSFIDALCFLNSARIELGKPPRMWWGFEEDDWSEELEAAEKKEGK